MSRGRRIGQGGSGLTTALGVFSLALGSAQVISPGGLSRVIGVQGSSPVVQTAQRVLGVREIVQGTGILASSQPRGWVWSRVAGDVLDVGLFLAAARATGHDRRRIAITLAALTGVGAADLVAALQQSGGGQTDTGLSARASITVNKAPDEVYRQWRDLERLPEFMAHLRSVQAATDGRSHWVAEGPAGRTVEWDAEIVEDRPGEQVSWRSVPGADVDNHGSVRFTTAPGGRGTEVHVELRYRPPGGRAGRAVATLLGEEPNQQLRDDLRRFKQVLEIGEVVRSEGSPTGQSTRQQVAQRPAQPQR